MRQKIAVALSFVCFAGFAFTADAAQHRTGKAQPPAVGAANPASAFCVQEMGGRSEIATLRSGDEIGLCYLSSTKIVEEWTLFRMFDGKRPTNYENPFLSN